MPKHFAALGMVLALAGSALVAADAKESTYRGWKSLELSNGLIRVQVVPGVGGRIMQVTLGDFEHLWVNDGLAGKGPTPTGLGPEGSWLNYGGSKLWPAPQGWGREDRWPGPPDAILDGGEHEGSITADKGEAASILLVSRKDPRSGIQFTRSVKVRDGASRVSIDCTMKNIDTKNRRWGIWQVTQHGTANRKGDGFDKGIRVWVPLNPKSIHPNGYRVLFGARDNPQFKADGGMMCVHYRHLVGKIAMDCSAGWYALVNGTAGRVFVERFEWHGDKPYPDDASVEVWTQGAGSIEAWGKEVKMSDDVKENPYLLETEVLSPFAELKPGETFSHHTDWYVARIGGDHPVVGCNGLGVACEPLKAALSEGKLILAGRFGVFYKAEAVLSLADGRGKEVLRGQAKLGVSPDEPLVLSPGSKLAQGVRVPAEAAKACLLLLDASGKPIAALASAEIQR